MIPDQSQGFFRQALSGLDPMPRRRAGLMRQRYQVKGSAKFLYAYNLTDQFRQNRQFVQELADRQFADRDYKSGI